MLSIVIPAYNEEGNLAAAADTVASIMDDNGIVYEIVFVDDGSKDGTWQAIMDCHQKDPFVRGVSFSRNFGKEAAIYAGLSAARGECCAVMDCDLQHPPIVLVEMYRLWEQGYEVIEGVKRSRGKESGLYAIAAKAFYSVISDATGIDMKHASDFKLLDRKAVTVLLNMRERDAFFRALSSWVGFKTTQVPFDVQERTTGTTKWSKRKLIKYAINNIASFTSAPMQIVTGLGIIMFILAVLQGIEVLFSYFDGKALGGFTTVILLQLFTGSIIMMSLGVIGYYISKIFDEVKARPKYIVSHTTEEKEQTP